MFLGVDGGGTKTAFCLVGPDGSLLAQARTASVYHLRDGIGIVEPLLREGITRVCDEAGVAPADVTYSFVGLPAYGEAPDDVATLDALPGRVLGTDRYRCGNDMVCGWAGSLGGVDGINVVAGTGSIAYGEHHGRAWRAGGWGEIVGDEGSGYWVAVRGLNAFSRMSDGRLPRGPLHARLRHALGVADDLDVIDLVLRRWNGERSTIAALSRTVSEAAGDGDPVAAAILHQAGTELAALVPVGIGALGFTPDRPVPLSYSGGMFACVHVLDAFATAVAAGPARCALRRPLLPPVAGAAVHAARLAGRTFSDDQLRRLQSQSPFLERL